MDIPHTQTNRVENYSEILKVVPETNGFCVNIGCDDGDDVCDFFFARGYDGICVEPIHVAATEAYVAKLPGNVSIVREFATPLNVAKILGNARPDIVKVDVDGYDLALTRSVLDVCKPSVIIMEINEMIPPGVFFEVPFDPNWSYAGDHLFGCSISSAQRAMNSYGYKIVDIYDSFQRNNIVAVSSKDTKGDEGIRLWTTYLKNDDKYMNLPWNIDARYWTRYVDLCESDLKNMYLNRKYGTTLHTSLDNEPVVSKKFKDAVVSLLGESSNVADVGTFSRSGFSRLVIEHVLEHEADITLYKLESASRYYNESRKIFSVYGDALGSFVSLSHARIVCEKPPVDDEQYECWHFWTMHAPMAKLPDVDMAFVHVFPPWAMEAIENLRHPKHVIMMNFMYERSSVTGYDPMFQDDEFIILLRRHSAGDCR